MNNVIVEEIVCHPDDLDKKIKKYFEMGYDILNIISAKEEFGINGTIYNIAFKKVKKI